MEKKRQDERKRDYDKEPIVIKDYGAYFQANFLMLFIPVLATILIMDILHINIKNIDIYSFNFITTIASIYFCLWFIYYIYKLPLKFKLYPSQFVFYNNNIKHIRYMYDGSKLKNEISAPLKIEKVLFCIVTELTFRYGRLHYLTPWQLYRKSSIGVHIGKTVLYIRFLLTYILFVLPYKIYRLTKAKEPYWLLKKNFFIIYLTIATIF